MDLHKFVDIFLHLDKHLNEWSASLGAGLYGLLFLIVPAQVVPENTDRAVYAAQQRTSAARAGWFR